MAALAYGTQSIPAVDKIVGPGNVYVATAKRKVYGKVGIDMIAGPSEILVLADGGCNPAWVAADLLSQAEHDKLASPVLVTDSEALAKAVQAELEVQIPRLPRAAIARASVDDNGKIIVCQDLAKAIEVCNIIAPEHLEVCVEDPFAVLGQITERRQHFPGTERPRGAGGLLRRPQPHPAHQRHRPVLQPSGGGRLCQAVQLHLLHPGGPGGSEGPDCLLCREGGPPRSRPERHHPL